MRPLLRCFGMLLRQVAKDSMLYAVLAAPLLAGSMFRFGIPYIETLLSGAWGRPAMFAPYYLMFDLFLAIMTPYIFCFAASMVVLTERDENMAAYMAVTPVGKRGYIASRLVFPAVLSIFVSLTIMRCFTLTVWSGPMLLLTCGLASLLSIGLSLFIVSFSQNRVEGMALAKLAGIILLGLPVPFFLASGIQYLFSVLPSFWIAKLCLDKNYLYTLPALLTSVLWIRALSGRFARKLV